MDSLNSMTQLTIKRLQMDNAGLTELLRDEDGKSAAPALFKLQT